MIKGLINEWVSLWDHWTIWGLSLHHSCKFLSHLIKLQPAMRNLVPFLWNKSNIFTFILTNSIKAADLQKSIRSSSYLTTRHRPLSFLKWSNLAIFQYPVYSSVSFNQAASSIQTLGGYVFLSFNCSPLSPSPYLSIEKGQAPAIPHQIKLRIINL